MATGTRSVGGAPAAALAGLACLLPVDLPPAVRAAAAAWLALWVPGRAAAGWLAPGAPATDRAFLALALSPWLVAAPAAVLIAAGAPVAAAARVVLGAAALAGAWPARTVPAARAVAGARAVAAIALAVAAGTGLLLAANPHLAPRSDGWFHAAVALQIAGRGLPVEDPAFAGLPLLYFWGYHLWAALWLALDPRIAVWTPLVLFNVAAAAAVILGVDALAVRLGARGRVRALASGLAVLGYAPGGWLVPLARALGGETRGLSELVAPFAAGASSGLRVLAPGTLHASLAFFGDKLLTLTPFSLGIALFVGTAAWWLEAATRPSRRAPIALALLAGAALFFHTVAGFTILLVAGAWGAVTLAAGDGAARRAVAVVGLALGAALLAHAPYLLAVAGGKQSQLAPGLSARALVSVAWVGAAFVPAGLAWLAARAREPGAARHALVAALALAALGLALRLPENNQSKFMNLLFVLLAPAAALGWAAWDAGLGAAGRAALRALGVAALVPTAALALWGFAAEHGAGEDPAHLAGPGARADWTWARTHTAADAVFADPSGGGDMTVLAARTALWGGGHVERDWGHPAAALEARRHAARELGDGAPLSASTRDLLGGLGREVVVVARGPGGPGSARGRLDAAAGYRRLYEGEALALYRWEGAR